MALFRLLPGIDLQRKTSNGDPPLLQSRLSQVPGWIHVSSFKGIKNGCRNQPFELSFLPVIPFV
jgi:hypothetical protein